MADETGTSDQQSDSGIAFPLRGLALGSASAAIVFFTVMVFWGDWTPALLVTKPVLFGVLVFAACAIGWWRKR